jgi:thermostable 8-oxoguanine DNA glycosylase
MQLDFISIAPTTSLISEQFDLWNLEMDSKNKVRAKIKYDKVDKFFNSLNSQVIKNYKNYWQSISPTNDVEKFQRYLFAFCSVHTSWKSNLVGYEAIKDWTQWFNKPEVLKEKLEQSKVGLFNNRTKYIDGFSKLFWSDIKKFNKLSFESWAAYRNRLEKSILGLGLAKTSFALEMIYPNECEVTCMDTHLFQLYGLDQTRDSAHYEAIETHWISMCKVWNVPSYIARCIWWDINQNKTDSRYWSYVLEA